LQAGAADFPTTAVVLEILLRKTMKALFVPFAPSLAHVSRCLAVAEAWRAQGYTAMFAVGTERVQMVKKAGFVAHPLPEVPGEVFRTGQGFRWLNRKYIEQNMASEQRILAEMQPAVVVFDFRFTTALSAHLAGIPSVSIVHGNALRLALQPGMTAQLLIGDSRDLRGIAALRLRVMRALFPIGFRLAMRAIVRPVNAMRKGYGLQPVKSPFELLLGDEVLVADIPSLLPAPLPSNCHIVGPLMWSGWTQPLPWLDELEDASPLIYVTMGSTVEAQPALIKIIEALRDSAYTVVVSTGNLTLPSELSLPAHMHVFSTVPGETVIQRSRAVIHHGGHGTLMQVLKAGVPSLILPANPDQILVAQQVQALGAGYTLWHPNGSVLGSRILEKMTSAQIRNSLEGLIADQDCVRTCRVLRQEIERYQGAITAANTIEKIAATTLEQAA
jgi:UDP:flavonoid glycosyltransferase YjiC (YdhE family)